MLCKTCVGALQHRCGPARVEGRHGPSPLYVVIPHHYTTESLEASAAEACHICTPIWSHVSASIAEVPPSRTYKEDESARDGSNRCLTELKLQEQRYYRDIIIHVNFTDYFRSFAAIHRDFQPSYLLQPIIGTPTRLVVSCDGD